MEAPSQLPPGIAALARTMGLGDLADAAERTLQAPPAADQLVAQLQQLTTELQQLRDQLQPLAQLGAQLAPLLQLPKVRRAIDRAQV